MTYDGSDRTGTRRAKRIGRTRRMTNAAVIAALTAGITCAATGLVAATPDLPATDTATGTAGNNGPATSMHGIESGMGYFARITPDGGGVATTLDAGTFSTTPGATVVTVADRSGTAVAAVPLAFHAAGRDITLIPAIEDGGATLTLRPVAAPLTEITAQERWNEQVQRGTFGALIGAAIGGLITIPFWIFVLPPLLGIGIGAAIGFAAVGGQPLIDAGIAYFTGQP